MCPTCQGERTAPTLVIAERCPACYGTGDPNSYGATVRATLTGFSREDLEDLVLDLVEGFFGSAGTEADEPLPGADFVAFVGELLGPFHPHTLRSLPPAILAGVPPEALL